MKKKWMHFGTWLGLPGRRYARCHGGGKDHLRLWQSNGVHRGQSGAGVRRRYGNLRLLSHGDRNGGK